MGALRLCLALLVAMAHLGAVMPIPPTLAGQPVIAVRIFFVLSGFYMALVLSKRYARPSAFYASRLLKLLPIYWVVSVLTFAAAAAATGSGRAFFPICDPIPVWQRLDFTAFPTATAAYVIATLSTLVAADSWMWLGINPVTGAWSFAPTHAPGATTGLALAGVPQAWTLGLEIWFYLLAPFLVRLRTAWLLGLIVASIALRLWFAPAPPLDRYLFPLELAFFLTGIVLYRWRFSIARHSTKLAMIDAELGMLSYPAYVSHFLVFGLLRWTPVFALRWTVSLPIALASLVAFSFALDRLVARPIDGLRVRFGARARSHALEQPAD